MPPLSVGISAPRPAAAPAASTEEAGALRVASVSSGDMFECTFGTHGVAQLSMSTRAAPSAERKVADLEETLRAGSATKVGPQSGMKWVRGEAVGRGSLGTVYQAMDQQTGQLIAVKEVAINSSDSMDLKFKEQLENEIKIVQDLKHDRIVAYLGHDYMDSCLYIYLEFMAGGCVSEALAQFGCFEESLVVSYTRELLEGLQYLHTRDPPVIHRDIKGANVLVDLECHVKLSDFGCSKRTEPDSTMAHTLRGSIPWVAPEVLKGSGYGRKADIWSLGCVMIEMATAKHPWGSFDNPMAAMCKIAMSDATSGVHRLVCTERSRCEVGCDQTSPA
eukprot:TRINITY_DN10841_c0_g1_i2.p1 TRINITY_DN10841_c0_g1~~TRINITY_DN10841_c0_g1_i2.p1  ORF type:complete len:355 (+),score=59.55 TRINITY_DN10841_c0_g1_i2:69-1067(+)